MPLRLAVADFVTSASERLLLRFIFADLTYALIDQLTLTAFTRVSVAVFTEAASTLVLWYIMSSLHYSISSGSGKYEGCNSLHFSVHSAIALELPKV